MFGARASERRAIPSRTKTARPYRFGSCVAAAATLDAPTGMRDQRGHIAVGERTPLAGYEFARAHRLAFYTPRLLSRAGNGVFARCDWERLDTIVAELRSGPDVVSHPHENVVPRPPPSRQRAVMGYARLAKPDTGTASARNDARSASPQRLPSTIRSTCKSGR